MLTMTVTGMTCEHCVRAVREAVRAVTAAGDVSVDLTSGRVAMSGNPDPAAVRQAIVEEGYAVAA